MFWEIGVVATLFVTAKLIVSTWNHLKCKKFDWDTNKGQYWAVVTGSTDGIGFEFARQLAQKGYNLMLISRNPTKLTDTSETIRAECPGVRVRTLAVDFEHSDIYDGIEQFLDVKRNDIYILVNNVGAAPNSLRHFIQEDRAQHQKIITVNVFSVVRMTELVLGSMMSKRRGLILNVSSLGGLHIVPSFNLYCATKALVSHFSRTLYEECLSSNVLIYTLNPGPISTNLMKNYTSHTSFVVPMARDFVANAIKQVNWTKPDSTGYRWHTFSHIFSRIGECIFGTHTMATLTQFVILSVTNRKSA